MCSWLYVFTEATLLREYIEWKNYERKTTYFDPNEPTIEMRLILEKCGEGTAIALQQVSCLFSFAIICCDTGQLCDAA